MLLTRRWPHFDPSVDTRMACACCGKMELQEMFMRKVVEARIATAMPWVVTSGYRCPAHNNNVSSTGLTGPHTTGRALDIAAHSSEARLKIMEACQALGMRRFGIARTFIHIDDLTLAEGFPPGIWAY